MTTLAKKQSLTPEMKAYIMQSVYAVLGDPDLGLELAAGFKKKLQATERMRSAHLAEIKEARKEVKAKKVISQEQLFKRLDL